MTSEDNHDAPKISGWNGTGLNDEGRINAARVGRALKSLGITSITSSNTRRALETSKIASRITGIPVTESERLKSWNMGALQGMLHETARPFLNFFEENPDVKVPQGEKFRTFYNRFKGAFDSLVSYSRKFPDAKPAVFTHSQDLALIEWFLEGKEPGGILKVPDKMAPGSIFEVNVEGDKITMRKVKV